MIPLRSLGVILFAGLSSTVEAQTWEGRGFYVNVNAGVQPASQTFSETSTFDVYGEQGTAGAGHSIGGGSLFDLSVGARVWRDLGVGLGYSAFSDTGSVTAAVRVPHPIIIGQQREASASAADLEHAENAIHVQLLWMMPVTTRFQVALIGGPSFFTVRQDLATVRPEDIADPPPFTAVSIRTVTVTNVKKSSVGVNIGLDGTYFVRRRIGVGGFLRYAAASVALPTPAGSTLDDDLKAGGFQTGIGLRVRF